MGTREGGTPTKTAKTPTAQEQPNTPSYTEWAAAFQAYYGPGTTPPHPGYFPSAVASGPQPHPYMWGGQPMMPPYGTPAHAALYPYGGIYAHPSMAPGAHPYGQYAMPSPCTELAMAAATTETEAKSSEGKDRNAIKRSKGSLGSLGMITGTGSEGAKATSGSANGHSQSGESGTEGSTEGSEEDITQNGSHITHKGSFDLDGTGAQGADMPAYAGQAGDLYMTQGGHAVGNPVNQSMAAPVTGKPAAGPTTNLNIGMDYWSASTPTSVKGKRSSASMSTGLVPAPSGTQLMGPGRDGMGAELWLQDERELKRQRRKQSNRESARRSRLRKQAECEELSTRVDTLTVENLALRTELDRLADECKKLSSDNAALLEKLQKFHGEDAGEFQEQEDASENQQTQPERNAPDQNGGNSSSPHFGVMSNQRILEHCETAANVPPCPDPRGHSDVTAAG